jgi:hypothetical protein
MDDVQQMILDELRGIRKDLQEVREHDIPTVKQDLAVFKATIMASAKSTALWITSVGSVITFVAGLLVAWWVH